MTRLARLVVIAGLLVPPCTAATAQQPRGAPPPRPSAGTDAPRAAFEALSEADRIAIQDALVWTGDYAGGADGTFGRRTLEAIAAWQARAGRPPSGMLDAPSRAALLAAAGRARTAAAFSPVLDPASNVRIGLPQKLLVKKAPNSIGGTRYQSKDEKVTLDTRSQPGTAEDLQQLFERNVSLNTPGRTITYKLSRPDFFVIAGETSGGRFYSRYSQSEGYIRGFSIGYDRASAAELDRFVVAIANSFVPFPAEKPLAGMAATPTAPVPPPSPLARAPLTATGLALGPRQVLAPAAAIEGCSDIRLDGAPSRIEKPAADGFVVLAPAAPRRASPLRIAGDPKPGPATLIFAAASEGGRMVVTPAEITGPGRLVAPLQNGAAGAVVVDGAGAVVGMVARVTEGRRAVAGLVPPAGHDFVPASRLPVPSGAGSANPEIAGGHPTAALLPAVVRLTCGPAQRP